ncbi:SurA N-terminal domain-containing protein [Brevibacillus ruminantium]|uniref:SurA N-terminal domain-containing protein n=1 Tax=Brevibacillus ruminantium TaxID=2950604 RepID=A0ABY4WLQ6_9BACL|nr:SurA N-terminal domain-containing protein [Brevibacillus ruminantium]USG65576.1 SurA N-terminal domain-containing protein [Brevibacillus ruminantium]
MKKIWVFLAVIAVLSIGSLSYSLANDKLSDFAKGTEFAKLYQKTLDQFKKRKTTLDHVPDQISEDELAEKIAMYKAYSKIFGIELTESQAIEKLKERKLVAKYAKERNIYPSEEEIQAYIKDIADSFKDVTYDILDGMIAELGITEEEFFYEFSRAGYEEALVRLNIVQELKNKNEKREDETETEYHNRMLDELEKVIIELKQVM